MSIKYTGSVSDVRDGLNILDDSFDISQDCTVSLSKCERGFSLKVSETCAEISYNAKSDFFRAMSFAVDALRRGDALELSETPAFRYTGVMIDASRGAVPKTDTVKLIMRKMARMGLNELMLYTEDTYEIDGYPYFGYMRGRYSKDEIRDIVAYGNKLGIETVPCIQTLGHLSKPLRWAAFNDVKQSSDILMIGEEETYRLIEAMISSARECFTTKMIHIGMDEAHDVGLGRYLEKHGICNKFDILLEHLTRVKQITDKYGFEPMMWSDMFFRLASKTGDYYDMEAVLPDDLPEKLPSGVSQVYWDYYNHSEKLYDSIIAQHTKMGCPLVFAGGIWTWGVPGINYDQSFRCSLPALKACRKYGIENVFACLWGDDGQECDALEALLGLQLYAELCYRGDTDKLSDNFRICAECDADFFMALDTDGGLNRIEELTDYTFRATENQISVISKQALYQNPMMGFFDKHFENLPLKEYFTSLHEKFEKLSPAPEWTELYDSHLSLLKVLKEKSDIGNRLIKAYGDSDKEALKALIPTLSMLEKDITDYKLKREKLWYKYNKPFGFENISGRLSHLADMFRMARARVLAYINGEVSSLEELSEPRLLYNQRAGIFENVYFASYFMKL